jgi:hypothetical protein
VVSCASVLWSALTAYAALMHPMPSAAQQVMDAIFAIVLFIMNSSLLYFF